MSWFRKRKPEQGTDWSVVQELLPFGYRTVSKHPTEASALKALGYSSLLTVKPTAWVKAENQRLNEPIEFDRELSRWAERNAA